MRSVTWSARAGEPGRPSSRSPSNAPAMDRDPHMVLTSLLIRGLTVQEALEAEEIVQRDHHRHGRHDDEGRYRHDIGLETELKGGQHLERKRRGVLAAAHEERDGDVVEGGEERQ